MSISVWTFAHVFIRRWLLCLFVSIGWLGDIHEIIRKETNWTERNVIQSDCQQFWTKRSQHAIVYNNYEDGDFRMSPWWSWCTLYLSHVRRSYRRRLGSLLLCACWMCDVNCSSAVTSHRPNTRFKTSATGGNGQALMGRLCPTFLEATRVSDAVLYKLSANGAHNLFTQNRESLSTVRIQLGFPV